MPSGPISQGQRIQLLDEVVECLRDAVKTCPPGSHLVLFELAKALFLRFMETHSNDDYDASTAAFEKILDPKQPGECPDAIRHLASESLFLSMLAYVKSSFFKNPDNIEAAISRMRIELSSPFIDEELRFCITESLSVLVLGITVSRRAAKKRILMFHK